ALFLYDCLVTIDSEVTLFWLPGRVNGAVCLFLVNRYFTLVAQILGFAPQPKKFNVCRIPPRVAANIVYYVTSAMQYFPWAAFSALRTHALCQGRYRTFVAAVVFALSVVPLVMNMIANLHFMHYVEGPGHVFISLTTLTKMTVATRLSLVAADILVLCVTWSRTQETITARRRSEAGGRHKRTFAGTLLRDGSQSTSSRLTTLLILNILHIAFTVRSVASAAFTATSVIPDFEEPLTAILTSRFLINLQEVKQKLSGSSRSMSTSDLAFGSDAPASVPGSTFGAQLVFPGDDAEESEHEGR
ncbi:hypothetical protein BD311DRAFT_675200, partial [Dichomitus squalens]